MFEKDTSDKAEALNSSFFLTLNCQDIHITQKEIDASGNDKVSASLKYHVSVSCPDISIHGCEKIYLAVVVDCYSRLIVCTNVSVEGAKDCFLGAVRKSVKTSPSNRNLQLLCENSELMMSTRFQILCEALNIAPVYSNPTEPSGFHDGIQMVLKQLHCFIDENEFSNIRTLKRKMAQWIDNSTQSVNTYTLKPNRIEQRSILRM